MFERFKLGKKFLNADRTAAHVAPLFRTCMCPALKSFDPLDPRLKSDQFVVGYIYGATAVWSLRHEDQQEKGFLIQQVFERLFPDEGRTLTETCTQWARQKNAEFVRAGGLGYKEMIEAVDSEGQKSLRGLMDHIRENY
jgi:hypothetical protein